MEIYFLQLLGIHSQRSLKAGSFILPANGCCQFRVLQYGEHFLDFSNSFLLPARQGVDIRQVKMGAEIAGHHLRTAVVQLNRAVELAVEIKGIGHALILGIERLRQFGFLDAFLSSAHAEQQPRVVRMEICVAWL